MVTDAQVVKASGQTSALDRVFSSLSKLLDKSANASAFGKAMDGIGAALEKAKVPPGGTLPGMKPVTPPIPFAESRTPMPAVPAPSSLANVGTFGFAKGHEPPEPALYGFAQEEKPQKRLGAVIQDALPADNTPAYKLSPEKTAEATPRSALARVFHGIGGFLGNRVPTVQEADPGAESSGTVKGQRESRLGAAGAGLHNLGGTLGGAGKLLGGRIGGTLQGLGQGAVLGGQALGQAASGNLAGAAISGLGALKAAGPAIMGVIGAVSTGVGKLISIPFQGIAAGANALTAAFSKLGTSGPLGSATSLLGSFGGAVSGLGKFMGPLGPIAQGVGQAIQVTAGVLDQFMETTVSLGRAASPAAFRLFDLAVRDTQATIGRVFVPLLELMTQATRGIGDAFSSILPSTQEVRAALSPLSTVFEDLKGVFATFAPLVRDSLQMAFMALGGVLKSIVMPIHAVVTGLQKLGLIARSTDLKSSQGAAGRETHIGSTQEYLNSVYTSAFKSGTATQQNPMPGLLERLTAQMTPLISALEKLTDAVSTGQRFAGIGQRAVSEITRPFRDPLSYLSH